MPAPPLSAAAAGKSPAPAIVTYTVQKGETLWDVAVQHGVSMRTVKDLNKLPGKEPALAEGQQLLVPASGITQVAAAEAAGASAAPAATLGSASARGLWVGSEHVRLASVAEARQLYLSQCERANSQHSLLVLFAPWCPHCRDLEDELERLAEGLSHEAAVRVVAVNGDSAEGRLFAREVLGVAYYPSVIAFPAASRTFYKYKGRSRDAEALLRFLNMTCCAREDAMWALRPAGQRGVEAAGGGQWFNQRLPLGITPGAAAAVVAGGALVLAAAAAAVSYATSRRPGLQPEVVAELDVSLGRMGTLMLRALKARAGLTLGVGVGQAQAESPAAAAAAEATEGMGAGAKAHELEPGPLLSADEAAAVVGASAATAEAAPSPGPVPAEAASTPHSTHVPSQAAAPSAQPQLPPLGGNGNGNGVAGPSTSGEDHAAAAAAAAVASATTVATRELTAEERHRLTRLTDDELIALVNSDPNLDVVLAKLLGDKK